MRTEPILSPLFGGLFAGAAFRVFAVEKACQQYAMFAAKGADKCHAARGTLVVQCLETIDSEAKFDRTGGFVFVGRMQCERHLAGRKFAPSRRLET